MPKNHVSLVRIFIPAASIATIFLALSLQEGVENTPRTPASLEAPPVQVLYPSKSTNYAKLAMLQDAIQKQGASLKLRQGVEVSLDLVDDYKPGTPFTLKATVTAEREFTGLKYDWRLGPGVQVLSGKLEGEFASISPDEPQVAHITLQKVSGVDPAKAYLHVKYEEGSGRFTQIGRFSSKRQFHGISSGQKPKKEKQQIPEGLKVIY